jgi:hypothetical protein
MNRNSILHKTLARALSMKRPHNSEGTQRLTDWLEDRAVDLRDTSAPHIKIHRDGAGNLHIDTRLTATNRTLFTAHVDTVHRTPGPNKIRKTATHWHADGAPLGADDGAGVAMLMHLLHSGVNAYYLFTQGEECGGIGATFAAKHDAALWAEFDRAIAFDRRGIDSVITHQGYGRCCSDVFAEALANELCADMTLMYSPDNTGVYTDTAEFTHIIPECTNISVGYAREHSEEESLDVVHFVALADRVVLIDWDALPTDRDPTKVESLYANDWMASSWGGTTSVTSFSSTSDFSRYYHLVDDDTEWLREDLRDAIYDAMAGSTQWLIELICESVWPEDPDTAAAFIDRNKLSEELLAQALQDSGVYDPDVVLASVFDQAYKEH